MVAALEQLRSLWDPSRFVAQHGNRIVPGERDAVLAGLASVHKRLQGVSAQLAASRTNAVKRATAVPDASAKWQFAPDA